MSKPKIKIHAGAGIDPPSSVTTATTDAARATMPAQPAARFARPQGVVTDSPGRQIGWRKLSPLQRIRVMDMIGPDSARNMVVLGQFGLAACCTSIDGEQIVFPKKRSELEAVIQRLDEPGLDAISAAFEALAPKEDGESDGDDDGENDGSKDVERAKN